MDAVGPHVDVVAASSARASSLVTTINFGVSFLAGVSPPANLVLVNEEGTPHLRTGGRSTGSGYKSGRSLWASWSTWLCRRLSPRSVDVAGRGPVGSTPWGDSGGQATPESPGALPTIRQMGPPSTVALSPLTGRALVEACLSGTPVVAYHVEWHSDLVSTGETGVLLPYRRIQQMAEAVCLLSSHASLAAAIGQKARAAALEMMYPSGLKSHERAEYLKLLRSAGRRFRASDTVSPSSVQVDV